MSKENKALDKARRKAIKRLRKVELNQGSHENLSAICDAVYKSDWGWTRGACEGLRMTLLWLLGDGDQVTDSEE